jgi:quinoprotein glucose dehydrogenase
MISPRQFIFPLVGAALVVFVGPYVAPAADKRSDKWWWDNLSGPDSSNFVNLDQINKSNVNRLEVAWYYPYGGTLFNPVVVDNVMYVAGRNNALIALDAITGKEIWIHDSLAGMVARGVNYWQSADGKDKRLITAVGGYLQELDATSGKTIRTFGDNGAVDLRTGVLRAEGTSVRLQSNSPGKVWQNTIILGSATGEGYVGPPGDIRAYDVITGKKLWQFHTVPWPGEFGYETWPKDAWRYTGGVNNWGSMSVDDERGIVYIPLESAHYEYYGADRIGTNLFANCLIALDARTGKRLWHFQTVHHDIWDMTPTSAPQLVTVTHNGKKVDVVAVATKIGFLYVFNRVTGEPLWPIEERPVPKSDTPGEQVWPTQPFPTKPPAFSNQSFTEDDVSPYLAPSEEEYEKMRDRVAKARKGRGQYGGLFNPLSLEAEVINMPGNEGGSNWGTTAADPRKGLVFVLGINQFGLYRLTDPANRSAGRGEPEVVPVVRGNDGGRGGGGRGGPDTAYPPGPVVETGPARALAPAPARGGGGGFGNNPYPADAEAPDVRYNGNYGANSAWGWNKPPYSLITAYDLNTGEIKWQVPNGDDPRTVAAGGPHNTGGIAARQGFVVTKSGLVFHVDIDSNVRAYDEDTGKVLWSAPFQGYAAAGVPASYESNGRQFVVINTTRTPTNRGGEGVIPGRPIDPEKPIGTIVYALPVKK